MKTRRRLEEWMKMTRLSKVAELRKKYNIPSKSSQNIGTKLKKDLTSLDAAP